jgi:hypothetical protein
MSVMTGQNSRQGAACGRLGLIGDDAGRDILAGVASGNCWDRSAPWPCSPPSGRHRWRRMRGHVFDAFRQCSASITVTANDLS